eukprot:gene21818-28841_t
MKRFSGQQQSIIGDTSQFTNCAFEESEENHQELEAPHTYFEGNILSRSASESMDDCAIGEFPRAEEGGSPEGGSASSRVHYFNPTSSPNNPLFKVLVPFHTMTPLVPASASKAADVGMCEPGTVTRGLLNSFATRTKTEGSPPSGYVWLWRNHLLRWRRRYIVTSPEAPGMLMLYRNNSLKGKVCTDRCRFIVISPEAHGVLMLYRNNSLKGKVGIDDEPGARQLEIVTQSLEIVLSVSLIDATVEADEQEARQLRIVTNTKGKIFIRASNEQDRNHWVACLHEKPAGAPAGLRETAMASVRERQRVRNRAGTCTRLLVRRAGPVEMSP